MPCLSSRCAIAIVTLACALPCGWAQPVDFRLGSAIAPEQAERSITIGPDTRWANVRQGESIRFVAGPGAFAWKFDGSASSYDLARIAPAGFLSRPITVYIVPTHRGRAN